MASICTTSLTFSNSTFCPHCIFVCFVWIWEQTRIISLYNINWLVFITETECVYCAVRTECLTLSHVNLNRRSTFRPSSIFVCFVWIWEQTAIISLYNINWLAFITKTECLLRGTGWVFKYNSGLNKILRSAHTAVFMCFVWIWEQTAIISLYNIDWFFYNQDGECLLRGTSWVMYHSG